MLLLRIESRLETDVRFMRLAVLGCDLLISQHFCLETVFLFFNEFLKLCVR